LFFLSSSAVMKTACKAAAESLAINDCPLEAVKAAITILEDDPLTNAGNGSNLTIDGFVECDASVMAGDGTFGSIAAAPGIQNPCVAATRLALDSREPLSHGRVRPVMLAGDASRVWALKQGLEAAESIDDAEEMHITKRARRQHQKYINILNENNSTSSESTESNPKGSSKRQKTSKIDKDSDLLNDTVGCCVINSRGQVASGVSSGGIAMKTSGRVGEAAVYGAGCWAEESKNTSNTSNGVSVSVTGVGERIIKHLVARDCAKKVLLLLDDSDGGGGGGGGNKTGDSKMNDDPLSICTRYLNETIGQGPTPRDCGVLCLSSSSTTSRQQQPGHLHVILTAVFRESESMAVGWLSEDSIGKQRSEARVLRKNNSRTGGSSLTSQSLVVGVHWPLQ
jgi:isoaspartyl peptidase/L-asparaginase-like protein (Ntn-hydrolase superfamily)